MSGFEWLKEKLPSKENFYNSLTSEKISGKNYEHALEIWNTFEMRTITRLL